MKNLSLLLLALTAFVFVGCSDDDKATLVTSFENKLTKTDSEFVSESKTAFNDFYFIDTFKDNSNQLTLKHYFGFFPDYTFAGFTYTNYTNNTSSNSIAAITKKGKVGSTYLSACTNSFTPAEFAINTPEVYKIKGAWVTNSTYAYNAMTTDQISDTTPFKKGDSFKLTATGYSNTDVETGSVEIYLANYTNDTDKPVNEWIWFDMTELGDAVKVKFSLSSTDNGQWGMNTPAYFCMDGITLEEK